MTKSTKSHQRERSPLFEKSSRVHELVARAMRVKCVRHRIKRKPAILPLHGFSHTTRANISHEIAEQIRARVVCTPAESARRELTHMRSVAVRLSSACGKGQDFINPHQAFLIGYQDFLFFQYFFDRPFRLLFRRAFLYEKCT